MHEEGGNVFGGEGGEMGFGTMPFTLDDIHNHNDIRVSGVILGEIQLTLRGGLDIDDVEFVPHITIPLVNEAFTPTENDGAHAHESAVEAFNTVISSLLETPEKLKHTKKFLYLPSIRTVRANSGFTKNEGISLKQKSTPTTLQ